MLPVRKRLRSLHAVAVRSLLLGSLLAGSGSPAAEELRDPFLFWPPPQEIPQPAPPSVLLGILWEAQEALALINGEPTTVGQTIAGWELIEIKPDHVVVRRDSQQRTVLPGEPFPTD